WLAQYIQVRAADRAPELPQDELPPEQIRQRAYLSGPAFAFLLDAMAPGWKERLERDDARFLDELIEEAARGDGAMPQFDAAAELERARRDVDALGERRAKTLAAFVEAPGPRLAIEAGREPLWPQRFDPLNVQRLSAAQVLHSRALT